VIVRLIRGDVLQPLVVGDQRHAVEIGQHSARRGHPRDQPVHFVRVRAVGGLEPIQLREGADAGMDINDVIGVCARIDDREREVVTRIHHARAVGNLDPLEVAFAPRGDVLAVPVQPADPLVEVQEFLDRDVAAIERLEAVLNSDVVVDGSREPGLGIDPEDVDHPVGEGAAGSGRIGDRIVASGEWHHGIEAGEGVHPVVREPIPAPARGVGPHRVGRVPVDHRSAAGRPVLGIGDDVVEVVIQEPAVRHVGQDRHQVRV
jgi:hypothetical protein